MKEIDLALLKIEDITLLSLEEVKDIPESILKYHGCWWLRSPGHNQYGAAFVIYDGSVNYFGYGVHDDDRAVRPALRISNLESLELEVGDIVGLKGVDVEWVVVSDEYLLCADNSFGVHRFDEESNDYENSDIKDYIHKKAEWLGILPKRGVNDDEFGTICICAERYALGRQTYMPGIVQDFIRRNINFVDTRAVIVMIKDLTNSPFYGDEVIDKPGWITLREFLEKELEGRHGR